MIFKINRTTWEAGVPTDMSAIPYFVSHIAVELKGETLIYEYNEMEITVNVMEAHMLLIRSDRFAHKAKKLFQAFSESAFKDVKSETQYKEAALQAGGYFYLYCIAMKLELKEFFPPAFDFMASESKLKESWDKGFKQQEKISTEFLNMKLTESSPVH